MTKQIRTYARSITILCLCLCVCGPGHEEIGKKFAEANKQFEARNTDQAFKLYQEVLDADSKHTGARVMTARIYYYNRKFKEANEVLEKAVDANPQSIDALFWLARVQSVIPEKKDEALKNLDLLLERDGTRVDALVLKGMLHEEKKDLAKAIASYTAASQEESELAQAYIRLAAIYGSAGLEDMKRKALMRAAFLGPELLKQK